MTNSTHESTAADTLRDALREMKRLRARLRELEARDRDPIAVVGMACRFPGGADTPDGLWKLLWEGRSAVAEMSDERWDMDAYFDPDPDAPGKIYTRHAALLDRIDLFDPGFFGISAAEADAMDPQQRLLIETCWEALENAGYAPDRMAPRVGGVFVGMMNIEYSRLAAEVTAYLGSGNSMSMAAGRISYLLGLQGPSMSVDTACSTSLVNIHLACRALRAGECDFALAGGVNLILSPATSIAECKARMLSPDGVCRTFDAAANGYVRGEGCGIVVLRRLQDALADRNEILAVVRGSAVNQDGRTQGLTAPNGHAQREVMQAALRAAGIAPADVGYLEAHGSATPLGDPIEMASIDAVYGERAGAPLRVGSIKTNLGHTEAAAGIAGFMKAVLALRHGWIPAHLHLRTLNPHIEIDPRRVEIPRARVPWTGPRRAAVSSFGFSGTNAHVILDAFDMPPRPARAAPRPLILGISARSAEALDESIRRYRACIDTMSDDRLADAAYTSSTGRSHHAHRLALVAADVSQLRRMLETLESGGTDPGVVRGTARTRKPKLALLFSGQGEFPASTGARLAELEPVFRESLASTAQAMRPYLDVPLHELLTRADVPSTRHQQPLLFAIQCALYDLWTSWGVRPDAVLGHSVGEYAAAYAANVLSRADAARLVCARGRLMAEHCLPGAMLAVTGARTVIERVVRTSALPITIAAYNAPTRLVLAGAIDAIERIEPALVTAGVHTHRLDVAHAFHSPHMEPMLAHYRSDLESVRFAAPGVHFISSCTGGPVHEEIADAEYWLRQIREPVRFADGIAALAALGAEAYLEIGPGAVVASLARECRDAASVAPIVCRSSLRRGVDEPMHMAEGLAALHVAGVSVDWGVYAGVHWHRRAALPNSVFRRERHWLAAGAPRLDFATRGETALPGRRLWLPDTPEVRFEFAWSANAPAVLQEHQLFGLCVVPAAMQLTAVVSGFRTAFAAGTVTLDDVVFEMPLLLNAETETLVQIILSPTAHGATFRVASSDGGATTRLHARGTIVASSDSPSSRDDNFAGHGDDWTPAPAPEDFYARLEASGIRLGPSFRRLGAGRTRGAQIVRTLRSDAPRADALGDDGLAFALDAALQVAASGWLDAVPRDAGESDAVYVPVALRQLRLAPCVAESGELLAEARTGGGDDIGVDVRWYDGDSVCAEIRGVRYRRVTRAALLRYAGLPMERALYRLRWDAAERPTSATATLNEWIVVGPADPLVERVHAALSNHNLRVARMELGSEFVRAGRGRYRIRPDVAEDWQRALTALAPPDPREIQGVVYVAPAAVGARADRGNPSGFENVLAPGLFIAQALAQSPRRRRLIVVTPGAHALRTDEEPDPVAAALWAFARVVAQEHSELQLRCIDADPTSDAPSLADEIQSGADDAEIALRDARRYAPRLVACDPPSRPKRLHVRTDATYLVTGGTGALGRRVAAWLVARGAGHVVLVSRRGGSAEIDSFLHAEGVPPARVTVLAADIANFSAIRVLLDEVDRRFPPLRGVIHAAGVLDPMSVQAQSWPSFRRVLEPKADGAWHLQQCLAGRDLDFVIGFSSATTMFGTPTQGSYAAANAYLDTLIDLARRRGQPAASIAWGPWEGGGMAAESGDGYAAALARAGVRTLDPDEALALLDPLAHEPWTMVAPVDWTRFAAVFPALAARSLFAGLASAAPGMTRRSALLQQIRAATDDARAPLVRDYCIDLIRHSLGQNPDAAGADASLAELGLDSLMALEIRHTLASELGVSFDLATSFQDLSVAALAREVAARLDRGGTINGASTLVAVDTRERAGSQPDTHRVEIPL